MATTYALQTNKGIGFIRNLGAIRVAVTLGDNYVTTSGGLTLDFTTPLADAQGNADHAVQFTDVVDILGATTTGWRGVFTKTSTSGQFTMKLFNGITEQTNAAVTGTLNAILLVA